MTEAFSSFSSPFLVADTQLYKRLCPSVGRSVGRSVREHESKSVKTRISAPAHPSATGMGRVSGLVFANLVFVALNCWKVFIFKPRIKIFFLVNYEFFVWCMKTKVQCNRWPAVQVTYMQWVKKQGRIHGSISRGQVDRSGKPWKTTLWLMDRWTDGF